MCTHAMQVGKNNGQWTMEPQGGELVGAHRGQTSRWELQLSNKYRPIKTQSLQVSYPRLGTTFGQGLALRGWLKAASSSSIWRTRRTSKWVRMVMDEQEPAKRSFQGVLSAASTQPCPPPQSSPKVEVWSHQLLLLQQCAPGVPHANTQINRRTCSNIRTCWHDRTRHLHMHKTLHVHTYLRQASREGVLQGLNILNRPGHPLRSLCAPLLSGRLLWEEAR